MTDYSQTLLSRLTPDKDHSHITGLQSPFQQRLANMLGGMPEPLRNRFNIFSGHRSVERQGQLWADALRKYGSPEAARKWVAPPGRSRHNHGSAADLRFADDEVKQWVHANAKNYGLHFPMRHEPWHIEPMGGMPSASAPASTYNAQNAIARATTGGSDMAAPIGGAAPAGGPVPMMAPPSGRRSKLAEALLMKAVAAKPQGWGDALNAFGSMMLGNQLGKQHDTETGEYRGKLAQALTGAKDADTLATTLIGSGDEDLMKQGVQLRVAANKPKEVQVGRFKFDKDVGIVDQGTGQVVKTLADLGIAPQTRDDRAPSGYRYGADGNLTFIPGGPADPANKPAKTKEVSEGAAKAANFANMMLRGEEEFMKLAPKDGGGQPKLGPNGQPLSPANPTSFWGQLRENYLPEMLSNRARSPEEQAYRQAAMQWIRAKLRKESGAQISPEEFEGDFNTFFPQPGDGPEVIQQKARARAEALEGMKAESRGAYEDMFPQAGAVAPAAGAAPAATPPAAGAPPQPKAPPPQAVQLLRSQPTPDIIAQFNAKYGPGAAEAILSQQPQQAPAQEPLPILGSPL